MRSPPKNQLRLVNQQLRITKNISPIHRPSSRPNLDVLVGQLPKLLPVKPSKHQRRLPSPPTRPRRRRRGSCSLQRKSLLRKSKRSLQKPRRRQPQRPFNAQPIHHPWSRTKSAKQGPRRRRRRRSKNPQTHYLAHHSLQLRQLESPQHAKPHPLAHRTSPQATTETPNSSMAS